MALKKVDEGSRIVSIDKVIGKSKNGIEVNGVAYWYSKKSGQSVAYAKAKELHNKGYTVAVKCPTKSGYDFNDVLQDSKK